MTRIELEMEEAGCVLMPERARLQDARLNSAVGTECGEYLPVGKGWEYLSSRRLNFSINVQKPHLFLALALEKKL